MRAPSGTDFQLDVEHKLPDVGGVSDSGGVEHIGRFTFGRRKMRDVFLIRAEYNRLTSGDYVDSMPANLGAWAIATLAVLTVAAPDGFSIDPDTIDPLLENANVWEDKVADVYTALRAKELSFRPNSPPTVQKTGP